MTEESIQLRCCFSSVFVYLCLACSTEAHVFLLLLGLTGSILLMLFYTKSCEFNIFTSLIRVATPVVVLMVEGVNVDVT